MSNTTNPTTTASSCITAAVRELTEAFDRLATVIENFTDRGALPDNLPSHIRVRVAPLNGRTGPAVDLDTRVADIIARRDTPAMRALRCEIQDVLALLDDVAGMPLASDSADEEVAALEPGTSSSVPAAVAPQLLPLIATPEEMYARYENTPDDETWWVVTQGVVPGVYNTWSEAGPMVTSIGSAIYSRKFDKESALEDYQDAYRAGRVVRRV